MITESKSIGALLQSSDGGRQGAMACMCDGTHLGLHFSSDLGWFSLRGGTGGAGSLTPRERQCSISGAVQRHQSSYRAACNAGGQCFCFACRIPEADRAQEVRGQKARVPIKLCSTWISTLFYDLSSDGHFSNTSQRHQSRRLKTTVTDSEPSVLSAYIFSMPSWSVESSEVYPAEPFNSYTFRLPSLFVSIAVYAQALSLSLSRKQDDHLASRRGFR
ncbi:hypothetical protein BV25DRAFT_1040267 [Artomyces pyxidatus]|uniref:Uncharacterized protein n=1 Tax=Artomyces pyxidatus TaxID=48021 RepID=A0ACB8STT3_9AGAM|nr:hypothetical protein BV25DRAFT_1040267 [Artomyces pyxidatus]